MFSDVAACVTNQPIHVDSVSMDVVEEDLVAIPIGPIVSEVDHRTAVGVSSSCIGGVVLNARFVAPPSVVADTSRIVQVIGDGFDIRVDVAVEMLAGLTLVVCPLDDMVQVRDHTGGDEGLAVVIEIDTPWIGGPPGEDLELVRRRMVSPDGRVHRCSLVVWGSWLADFAVREDPVASVEPTIGSPVQRVEGLVGVLVTESVQEDLGFAVGNIITVGIRDKHQIRSGPDPNATEADF